MRTARNAPLWARLRCTIIDWTQPQDPRVLVQLCHTHCMTTFCVELYMSNCCHDHKGKSDVIGLGPEVTINRFHWCTTCAFHFIVELILQVKLNQSGQFRWPIQEAACTGQPVSCPAARFGSAGDAAYAALVPSPAGSAAHPGQQQQMAGCQCCCWQCTVRVLQIWRAGLRFFVPCMHPRLHSYGPCPQGHHTSHRLGTTSCSPPMPELAEAA